MLHLVPVTRSYWFPRIPNLAACHCAMSKASGAGFGMRPGLLMPAETKARAINARRTTSEARTWASAVLISNVG